MRDSQLALLPLVVRVYRLLAVAKDQWFATVAPIALPLRCLQIRTFGLSMMGLDVRQESTRHSEVMDAITTYLGLGSYASWGEEERLAFLLRELQVGYACISCGCGLAWWVCSCGGGGAPGLPSTGGAGACVLWVCVTMVGVH